MLTHSEIQELQHIKTVMSGLQKGIERILEKNAPAEAKPRKRQNLKEKRMEAFREQYAAGKWQRKTKTT